MQFVVFFGSVRSEREGMRAVRWIERGLRRREHEAIRIDPVEDRLPMLDRMYKEYGPGEAPEPMERIAEHLRRADGLIVVSAEYNHAIPPALKNLLDHYQQVTRWRPSAIVTYSAGHAGGVRVQSSLRSVLGELGTVSIPTMLDVATISEALDGEGRPADDVLDESLDAMLEELAWFARALGRERADGVPYGADHIG